jgi:cytoskeleton protein RodZ
VAKNGATVLQDRRSKLVENQSMMSTPLTGVVAPSSAPRAGADLRAARERLGWPIEAVSAALRIRLPHLEALEEGRIDLLPGNAYAVGFLRTYARTLGLDPDEIARRFKAEASQVNTRTELVFPAPMPQRGVPAGAVVLLGVVLAIGAYAGWYRLSGEGRLPAETVAPVPERLATLAEQAIPPSSPSALTTPVVIAAAPVVSQWLAPDQAAPPVPSISPSSAAAAVPSPQAVVAPAAQQDTPAPDQPRIVVQATADAWLQVRDRSGGGVLLNKVLHSGESWPVPLRPNLVLTTGNAGGTQLVVDGVVTPVPGGSGAVRRDLPMDADLIRDGKLIPLPIGATQPNGTAQSYGTAPSGTTPISGTVTPGGSAQIGGTAQTSGVAPPNGARSATQ